MVQCQQYGIVLEVGDISAENSACLQKKDVTHINMTELKSVIKGINLALEWGLQEIEVKTDFTLRSKNLIFSDEQDSYDYEGQSKITQKGRVDTIADVNEEFKNKTA